MTLTPEARVKRKVSAVLASSPECYYHMPVPGGYGSSTLDYIGCSMGRFFAIETKAPGKKLTERQEKIAADIRKAGGIVFAIDGDIGELVAWLKGIGHL